MRLYNKDGKQIGVQDAKTKEICFFDKKDNLNPPKDFVIKKVEQKK
jgi:hypothetical protein